MTELDAWFERPDLPPGDRALAIATAAIWPADWERFDLAVRFARRAALDHATLCEMLLQATLFFGFPRVVSAFGRLQTSWPEAAICRDAAPAQDHADRTAAGRALFDAIYDDNANDVHSMLESFHPEFHDFVIEAAYGRIMTRAGLTPRQRELLAVAALAALGQLPQLIAHARGALRFGATPSELREVLATIGQDPDPLLERVLRKRT